MSQENNAEAVPLRVLDIHSHETKVNAEAMQILQRYTAMAEAGQIHDLVLVALCEGDIKVVSTRTESFATRLGMLEVAKADMMLSLQRDEE